MSGRVLIADKVAREAADVLTAAGFEVVSRPGLDEEALVAAVPPFHAILVRSAVKVTARVLAAAGNLKVVGRAGAGVDNIDVAAATARGILVMNVPGGNSVTAAEHTIALIFAAARRVPQAMASLRAGQWERSRFVGLELTGKTLGVVGYGAVGRIVADRALGLKMRVVAYDPLVPAFVMEGAGVRPARDLDDLLASSDVVSLHVPLNDETRNLLDREAIRRMKPGAVLVNCARGGLVDEAALVEALNDGHVAAAAIDVWSPEPPPADHALLLHPNVVATPHLGASTHEAQVRVAEAVAIQVRDYLLHGRKVGAVN